MAMRLANLKSTSPKQRTRNKYMCTKCRKNPYKQDHAHPPHGNAPGAPPTLIQQNSKQTYGAVPANTPINKTMHTHFMATHLALLLVHHQRQRTLTHAPAVCMLPPKIKSQLTTWQCAWRCSWSTTLSTARPAALHTGFPPYLHHTAGKTRENACQCGDGLPACICLQRWNNNKLALSKANE
eukprot:1159091-Pelagomonas_calceolata.AAC.3